MGLVLIIVLVLLLFGGLPQVSGRDWGYGPSGVLGLVLVVILILVLLGRI